MKKLLLLLICSPILSLSQQTTDLFISEYGEGSGYNKYIEIYNGTGTSVDLSDYQIWKIANGGSWPEYTLNLSGNLADDDVYIIYHTSSNIDTIISSAGDVTWFQASWNGNDAVGLAKNGVLIDVIGEDGPDPGNGWDVAGITDATKDHTLVRKCSVTQGNINWSLSAGTDALNSEWVVLSQNDWSDIGQHTFPCQSVSVYGCTDSTAINYNPLATVDDGSCCNNSLWNQIGPDIDGDAIDDYFGDQQGVSLSDDGNILAISAPSNDAGGNNSGLVRIYEKINANWIQIGQDIYGENANNWSGTSVSLSSDGVFVAIGANGANTSNGNGSGYVRIFENVNSNWVQVSQTINGEAAGDGSGVSVSISGNGMLVAIGAIGNDGNGSYSGHVRVYDNPSGNLWTQRGNDIDGTAADDLCGRSVSLNGDGTILAIGSDDANNNTGHVRVFEDINGSWYQLGQTLNGLVISDDFGYSVSINDDGFTLIVGALGNDNNGPNAGQSYIYEYNGTAWIQKGQTLDGDGTGGTFFSEYFGQSVSISNDGDFVSISSPGDDANGTDAGNTRIFKYNPNPGGGWEQFGTDIDGEAIYDNSGRCVFLSGDASTLAIGTGYNDANGANSGHVRVFGLNPCSGCADSTATNYNPTALIDDGSCTFSNCSFISAFTSIGSIGNCCYYVSNDTMSWTNANTLCGSSGGSMVSINSQQESDSLNILLGNTPPYGPNAHWIGLIDGNNTWNNGDPLTFTNYDASYTQTSGLYMYLQTNGFWDNSPDNGSEVPAGIYAIMEICGPVPGCTDSTAINYDPTATIDDGSCTYCNNDTSYTYTTSCDSVLWNGNWYTTSGTYDTTFTTSSAGFAISPSAKEGNNWCFGWSAGLDFNSGTPVAAICSLSTEEGCSSISDTAGNLLFYTDGTIVWDKNHTSMLNGYGLTGHFSSTQSAIIIKKPGSTTNYYIFTLDGIGSGYSITWDGMYFSEVDMTLNGGLGDVVASNKNTLVVSHTAEKVAAIKHQNGTDFWIVVRLEDFNIQNSNTYHAYLLTSSGLNMTPVISNVGPTYYHTLGYLKASPDGSKIAAANSRFTGVSAANVTSDVNLFDFDNSTGILSNPMTFDFPFNGNNGNVPYGVEFSPNSNILYVSSSESPNKLTQFDLLAGSGALIDSSRITILVSSTGGGCFTDWSRWKKFILHNGMNTI